MNRTLTFIIYFAVIPFLYPQNIHAQDKKTDSLLSITKKGTDKQKIDALNALVNIFVYDKPEEAKAYAFQSIALAQKISYDPGLGDAYTRIGIAYDVSGKYDSSIYYYEKALPIYNELNNLKGRGSALNNLGLIYWNMADYERALQYFFDALKDFESIGNDRYQANALNNIGLVYDETQHFQQALAYHQKARVVYEKINDTYLKGAVYNNLGNTFLSINQLDSAEVYYLDAINMHVEAKDDYGLSIAYNGYASILLSKNKLDESLQYYQKSLQLKEALNESLGQTTAFINMAEIFRRKKNNTLELETLQKAKDIAEKNNFKKELITIYEKLSVFYEPSNVPLAFEYYKKYNQVKDTVFNETSNRQITELNTKYETGKKELRLKQQDLQLTRKNLLLAGISVALVLMGLLGISFYKRYKLKQEKNFQLAMMKQQDQATRDVIEAEENERKRIAADLHDGVGQMMSAAKMNLSVFENELAFSNDQQRTSFENVISLVDESCREIRSVSHQMMPNALLKRGLASAIKEFIDKIDARVIRVSLHTEGLDERIDKNTETVLYRVIQECVNNVMKHAQASQLDIAIMKDKDGISASIEDNGKGFDASSQKHFEGIGIKNILSRINYLRGTVEFDSSPGKGTLVAIHVPVSE